MLYFPTTQYVRSYGSSWIKWERYQCQLSFHTTLTNTSINFDDRKFPQPPWKRKASFPNRNQNGRVTWTPKFSSPRLLSVLHKQLSHKRCPWELETDVTYFKGSALLSAITYQPGTSQFPKAPVNKDRPGCRLTHACFNARYSPHNRGR